MGLSAVSLQQLNDAYIDSSSSFGPGRCAVPHRTEPAMLDLPGSSDLASEPIDSL
jgi:hypothetical protein